MVYVVGESRPGFKECGKAFVFVALVVLVVFNLTELVLEVVAGFALGF